MAIPSNPHAVASPRTHLDPPPSPIPDPAAASSTVPATRDGGPADELLRLAVVNRPIPDVARVLAILKDCSDVNADNALREVAIKRPISDLVLLAELLNDPVHAAQGPRPASDRRPDARGARRARVGPGGSGPGRGGVAREAAGAALRWPTAAGLAVSGLALASLIPDSLRRPPYAATWLALLGMACLFLAGVMVVGAGVTAFRAALGVGAATVGTFVLPRLVGLAGGGSLGWLDPRGLIVLGAGLLTSACAAYYLRRPIARPRPWPAVPIGQAPLVPGRRGADTGGLFG